MSASRKQYTVFCYLTRVVKETGWTVSHFIQNEGADAGRDGRTCLSLLISQARMGTRKFQFLCSADHEQNYQPYRLMPSLLHVITILYIHTH